MIPRRCTRRCARRGEVFRERVGHRYGERRACSDANLARGNLLLPLRRGKSRRGWKLRFRRGVRCRGDFRCPPETFENVKKEAGQRDWPNRLRNSWSWELLEVLLSLQTTETNRDHRRGTKSVR